MSTTVEAARRFQELLSDGEEGPYVFSRMFSDDSRADRRRSKRAFKLLKKIDRPLRAMLREGERVSFLSSGVVQPRFLEWYLLGWAVYRMQRRALVVTSQRLLLLQIDARGNPRETRNQVSYAAVDTLRKTVLGNVKITFRNGSSALLTAVPRGDRKWLAQIFEQGFRSFDAIPADTGIENLCPHCLEPVRRHPRVCPRCGGAFKSPATAGLLSLAFPGAGDFYLGHRLFAALEAVMACLLWLVVVALAFDPATSLGGIVTFAVIAIGVAHGADALGTRHIARKGLLPASGGSPAWRFALAAVIPVAGLATVVATAPAKVRLRPLPVAVAGGRLPAEHLQALRSAGHVGPDEVVRFFYSDGPGTVLQDGNLFTDDRIVSYVADMDTTWASSARFEEVVDLDVRAGGSDEPLSAISVALGDGSTFSLIVATEGGGDRDFIAAMLERWREVRARAGGVWYDGGSGLSAADAVVLRGLAGESADEIAALERWWLGLWFGAEGEDWTDRGRIASADAGEPLTIVTIESADGERQEIYFRAGG